MNRLLLFLALAVPALSFAQSRPSRPTGLMTDLVEHTEMVWSGGFPTDLSLKDITRAKGSFQYVGIRSLHPSFAWIVPGSYPARQTAWQVILSDSEKDAEACKGSIWDSGWVEDARSTAVPYAGKPLDPSTVYYWRVRVRTDTGGESGWSEMKSFRTASELSEYSTPSYPLVKEERMPVGQSPLGNGNKLFDFGKDAFGQLRITLRSDTGADTVRVHLGERTEEGRVLRHPTTSVRYQMHVIPLKKGTHTYRVVIPPDRRNTSPGAVLMPDYIGEVLPFRFCELEGYKFPVKSGDLVRETVQYPFDMQAASFKCSDSVLNRVWELGR